MVSGESAGVKHDSTQATTYVQYMFICILVHKDKADKQGLKMSYYPPQTSELMKKSNQEICNCDKKCPEVCHRM